MAIILCLETATTNCSVAISRDGAVSSIREHNESGYSHSEKLHVFIKEVLAAEGLQAIDLDAVAVSKGPGSYTGLRIGVSAAKGICYAADVPLIAVPTLDVLARQVQVPVSGTIIPLLDARRMEVYSKVLDSDYAVVRETKAQIIDEHSFSSYLEQKSTVFVGSGAAKVRELFPEAKAEFRPGVYPSAREMAEIATEMFEAKKFENVAYFEPYYLKDFIAGKA